MIIGCRHEYAVTSNYSKSTDMYWDTSFYNVLCRATGADLKTEDFSEEKSEVQGTKIFVWGDEIYTIEDLDYEPDRGPEFKKLPPFILKR